MGGRILRAVVVLALIAAAAGGACHLWPARFAVNVPIWNALFGTPGARPAPSLLGSRIRTPDGLAIGLFAELPRVRGLTAVPNGDLLASVPREGRVVLLERDADGDGRSDAAHVLLEGLNRPHGMALRGGWLYVAETDAIGRVRFDPAARTVSGAFERIVKGLPGGGNHWTRTIHFGPDGLLYLTIGSDCNVCIEEDPRRAAMLRFSEDGAPVDTYATGLRNAVGFDWRPDTGELYATDNGRDLLGDDFPPCELDRIVKGGFYGWPFANGAREKDPDYGEGHDAEIATSVPPAHGFRAHNAPLGMVFLQSALGPVPRGDAIVALHGSWNRTRKDGYKVVSLHFAPDGTIEERDFVWGFLENDDVIGRPVDPVQGADGAVYVSDDYAGAVYRIAAGTSASAAAALPARPAPAAPAADPLAAMPAAQRAAADARGAALFEANACYRCHDAARADAGVVAKPLAGLRARYGVDDLAAFLAAPTPPMPVFPLSDAERRDLAVHLLARQ